MYSVDSKILKDAIDACMSTISMGGKQEVRSIILDFRKGDLRLMASNSIATYKVDIPADVEKPYKGFIAILPEVLASYTKNAKTLVLTPSRDRLSVKNGKRVSAEIYAVGSEEKPSLPKIEAETDLSSVAATASDMLRLAGRIKNRVDNSKMAISLSWTKQEVEVIIGDNFHVAVLTAKSKAKSSGSITLPQDKLERVLAIGSNLATKEGMTFAWSDTDFMSISNDGTITRSADNAKEALKGKPLARWVVSRKGLSDLLESLWGAADETSRMAITVNDKRLQFKVDTSSSKASGQCKLKNFKGKPKDFGVSINLMKDCMSAMDAESIQMSLLDNGILQLKTLSRGITVTVALALRES